MQQQTTWIQFIEGNDDCFTSIYKEYVGVLFKYGIQFTANEELVKDAIHDIFVKIYNSREQLSKDIHVKFYLLRAMKNHLCNISKRNAVFKKMDDSELLNILDNDAETNMITQLESTEKKQIVAELLKQLTDRQREAIYYRFVEELSMKEIGALMNMNIQSAQNIVHRSLKKMREAQVSPYDYPEFCIGRSV